MLFDWIRYEYLQMTNEEILAFIELGDMHEIRKFDADAGFTTQCRSIAPELAKEVLKIREQLNRDSLAVICAEALKDNEKLRSQLTIAVEALEKISNEPTGGIEWHNNPVCFESMAQEALKKIRGK